MISLYFHIPFCTKKCPYCHFYVIPHQSKAQNLLLNALAKEWQLLLPKIKNKTIVSIYFGGGTPTLIGAEAIQTILSWIEREECEVTIEANPEEVTLQLMQQLKQAGVNRVSIGVQSLDDHLLATLGRTHNSQKAIQAVKKTYEAGITNISIDLMYELPGQTFESWHSTLKQVAKLPISHLSLYNLTIEPHTPFFKKKEQLIPLLPSQETNLDMLKMAVEELENSGLKRYEISAFAKEGFYSRHNVGYWTARPFLGLGPSAFSYFDKKRMRNSANLSRYSSLLNEGKSPIDFEEELFYPDNLHELLAVELRLLRGVDLLDFEKRHGKLPEMTHEKLKRLEQKGWIDIQNKVASLSPEGLLFYDSVAEEII
ncbi:MAG TPA: radical SAM family heme chaperone HemW [Rhabdochlamydiaceae bacterium]|nr:radical SAM family heme chaperone HemW [Rhabdochlamydiaceae bacterium]